MLLLLYYSECYLLPSCALSSSADVLPSSVSNSVWSDVSRAGFTDRLAIVDSISGRSVGQSLSSDERKLLASHFNQSLRQLSELIQS